MQRVFAEIDSGQKGPLIIVVAALHGNEHIGFHAMRLLKDSLCTKDFIGKIVGVTGNLQAVNGNQRYLTKDLNRFFVSQYLNEDHQNVPEWHEARDLIDTIFGLRNTCTDDEEVHLLDICIPCLEKVRHLFAFRAPQQMKS